MGATRTATDRRRRAYRRARRLDADGRERFRQMFARLIEDHADSRVVCIEHATALTILGLLESRP